MPREPAMFRCNKRKARRPWRNRWTPSGALRPSIFREKQVRVMGVHLSSSQAFFLPRAEDRGGNFPSSRLVFPFFSSLHSRFSNIEQNKLQELMRFSKGVIVWKPPMFGFCPLFTPTLLSRRAGSDVDATAAADRTQKPRRCHVSTGRAAAFFSSPLFQGSHCRCRPILPFPLFLPPASTLHDGAFQFQYSHFHLSRPFLSFWLSPASRLSLSSSHERCYSSIFFSIICFLSASC